MKIKTLKDKFILDACLDINNAYSFKSLKELKSYLKRREDRVYAVFEIKDKTEDLK